VKVILALSALLFAVKLADRRITFDVVIVNTGKVDVDRSIVEFPKFQHEFGIVDARSNGSSSATYGGAHKMWPKIITVSWVDLDTTERAYRQRVAVPPPMLDNSEQPLELVAEIRDGKVCVYPRIYDLGRPTRYRFQQDPPCNFASLKMAEQVPVPTKIDF